MMRKNTGLVMALLLLALTCRLSAQKVYSLEECIQLSLKNNLQMVNSKIDQQKMEAQVNEAIGGLLPNVDITGQYQYYLKMPKMLVPAEMLGGEKGKYASIAFGSEQTTSVAVQLTQTLYNQRVFIGLKAAETANDMANIQVNKTKEDLIFNVSATYYNLQVIQQNLNLLDSNLVVLEKLIATNKSLKDNEIISKSAFKRIQINYENLKNERQNMQLMNEKAYNLLKFLLGVSLKEQVHVASYKEEQRIVKTGEGNVESRMDMMLMKQQVRLAEIDKKATQAEYYPSLAGVYNYSTTGYNNKVDPFKTVTGSWMKGSYVGLQLSIPVFNWGRVNKVKQKDFELQKVRNSYELMKLSAQKEVSDAINNYMSSNNSFENTKRSLSLAQDVFKSAFTEYQNGMTSLSDLLQIQNDLTTARNNYSNALVNMRIAEIELQKAKGELLSGH